MLLGAALGFVSKVIILMYLELTVKVMPSAKDGPFCDLCKDAMTQVENELNDPATKVRFFFIFICVHIGILSNFKYFQVFYLFLLLCKKSTIF